MKRTPFKLFYYGEIQTYMLKNALKPISHVQNIAVPDIEYDVDGMWVLERGKHKDNNFINPSLKPGLMKSSIFKNKSIKDYFKNSIKNLEFLINAMKGN